MRKSLYEVLNERIENDKLNKEYLEKLRQEWNKNPTLKKYKLGKFLEQSRASALLRELPEDKVFNFAELEKKNDALAAAINSVNPGSVFHVPSQDGRKFVPERDLPNPRPGDTCQDPDGNYWYAVDNNSWAEYRYDYFGNALPTGRVIDLRNRGLTHSNPYGKSVENNRIIPPTCSIWEHDWKKYTGLTEVFEYCAKCDEKRK